MRPRTSSANPLLRILQKLKTSVFQTSHFFSPHLFLAESKIVIPLRQLLPRNNPKFLLFAFWRRLLVGRLGFEPRQSDSKSLDLPLVDRPVNRRLQLDLTIDDPARSLCEHLVPSTPPVARSPLEAPARQRTGRAVEPPLHLPQTGKVQTEQSPNPRAPHKSQSDLHGAIRITTHQLTLGYSQGGILRKDDLFKVVLKTSFQSRCGQAREGYSRPDHSAHNSGFHQINPVFSQD